MSFNDELQEFLGKELKQKIVLEVPPAPELGDAALQCFELAKKLRKAPQAIAQELAKTLKKPEFVDRIEASGPYLNFFFKKTALAEKTLLDIWNQKEKYGTGTAGKGKTAAIEFSSPNIAKPMHFGHIRSTVIGNSLARLHEAQGYKVLRLNYLGDYGTNFGMLIAAYLKWGDRKRLEAEPIKYLLELYVRFRAEAEKNPALEDEARGWFKKLEDGNKEATKLWAKFRQLSLDEFQRIYKAFGISFDSYEGEAHVAKHVDLAIKQCEKITKTSEGALVVPLKGFEIPLMLRKSDGASTYAARDVAALLYRIETLRPDRLIYVVGHEQCLHFRQLFAVAEMLGYPKDRFLHVDYGLYLSPEGGKMATRKGRLVFMEDVLNETIALARRTIEEKNPKLAGKDKVARIVAVGALIFGDLMNDCNKDIVFDIKRFLSFEGDTGPYLQYSHARANSILRKAKTAGVAAGRTKFDVLGAKQEQALIALLAEYPDRVAEALRQYKPHIVAQYLLAAARAFNEFYHACPVLQEKDTERQKARLMLTSCAKTVLRNGLWLLGIEAPEEM